jgi:SanA protein
MYLKMKKIAKIGLSVIAAVLLFTIICNVVVIVNASGKTIDDVDNVPHREYGLLLATSPITPTGAHNFYFDNRIKATDELYKAGKIDYIIASGGDYTNTQEIGCDEPAAIRDSLMARGIPEERIILDYDGVRTVNSIVKAKEVYGIDSVLIISQKEHNQRAVYLAEHYGLNAIGYNALPSHIRHSRIKNNIREYFARVKMFFDIWLGSKPDFASEDELDDYDQDEFLRGINSVAGHDERDTIVGNFTGKGIDTIYVYTENHYPELNDYDQYTSYYAKSNNPELPTIELWGCDQVSPKLVYEGDVDSNGKDEWGYLHTWVNSQWRTYRIYTLVGNEWRFLIDNHELLSTYEAFRSSGVDIVEKGDRKGYVKINYAKWDIDDSDIHDTIVAATYTKITKENE